MDVGSGVIQDGWTFVWMAYGISWTVLGLYTVRVVRQRLRGGA